MQPSEPEPDRAEAIDPTRSAVEALAVSALLAAVGGLATPAHVTFAAGALIAAAGFLSLLASGLTMDWRAWPEERRHTYARWLAVPWVVMRAWVGGMLMADYLDWSAAAAIVAVALIQFCWSGWGLWLGPSAGADPWRYATRTLWGV